ncbi:Inner membrane protein yjiG [Actinobacillus lignieresii]|uniref:YjiG family protein n=1 Tax=Actinobacillus lignieresii TaxID=720 RepID=UPI000F6CEE03|nr:YjiG family protein [Actinobacillus lignieresii]VEB27532.1 Inner membrane protein yjiG [Actinobacillus lignieresii]
MSNTNDNKLVTDVFIEGARKGWNIAITSTIPNVLMAFVIIYVLNASGLLKLLGEYIGFIMAPLGLPGESIAVFLAAFLSWGGAAGVLVALVQEGTLNAQHIAILLPGMALVGSTVQYMGRVLGVLGVPGKHYLALFGICIINAYLAMLLMRFIV